MDDVKSIAYSIASDMKAYREWSGSNELDPRSFISFLKGEEPKKLSSFPRPNLEDLDSDYKIIKDKLEPNYFDIIHTLCGIKQKDFYKMSENNKIRFIEEGLRLCVLRNKF